MKEAARLQMIRDRLKAIEPGDWSLACDGDTMFVEARGNGGELVRILNFRRAATVDETQFVADAPQAIKFLLGLVDRAIKAVRQTAKPAAPAGKRKDFAAEAAIKCQEPAFLAFLEARHGLERPLTRERGAQRLRSVLGITSRKQLNEDREAAERWKSLRADFDAWRRAG
ncbi:hypothetical protein [Chelativorans oligotrophicus]|uniref:hypothetical protein n=1 Tax=Chelativorans oligotrophicus TaxID=449974 RepID=UPI001FE32251|nr:hypothetical protein [Chelativorans oligotrophicus]